MKIARISIVATILSGSIYFKAHGIEFKTIHLWEWDSTDEMAATVQAELPTWGQSRDFRLRPTPHLNLPNWGVTIHRDADMSKCFKFKEPLSDPGSGRQLSLEMAESSATNQAIQIFLSFPTSGNGPLLPVKIFAANNKLTADSAVEIVIIY
ncbi:hypothetical protein PGTUg99_018461 [Puccinia graminis f. sp. tritici]|uniref:Uncharacterized protein n=1 Tax=Puccinia graminis f. sp. tritici TaxID=56615 RepID=A0A5B0RSG5_PUCGR|nr:hypothetical protein PGTUg99_018461 [Puccinia graminis f. sp. tritici]